MPLTDHQRMAVDTRGGARLVSAAAGSGKTRVLTQRLLSYVSDPVQPVNIDRFLVITYTRAAAAELRDRIMQSLAELAAADPGDARLRRQQNLCCRAPIGTIHSFCTAVLREYSQLLGLSPAFTVLEEDRAEQLRQSVAARLLERRYERIETDGAFRLLADTVGAGRNDSRLQTTLLQLCEKLRSHPYPEDWAAAQKRAFAPEGVSDAAETLWGRELLDAAKARTDYWAGAMERAVAEIAGDEKLQKAYLASFSASAAALRELRRAMDGGWDRARAFSRIEFPRIGAVKNYPDPEVPERLKSLRSDCKDACAELETLFSRDSAGLLAELRAVAPAMEALLDLALDFDRAYGEEKRRREVLDFSDLEHLAARLLVDKASGAPTWVARELSQRYTEIMVDEYQDVNAVQELIFRAVSRDGQNLFLVGDVKQSIYRFRLADPGLFLEKYGSFAPAESAEPGAPRRIDLQENFRSRRPVLDAANRVMGCIMSRALGELDYDGRAALKYGALGYDPALDHPAELHIIDGGADAEPGTERSEPEARFIADTILDMMRSGAPVTEDGKTRPCRWSDFVLLLRSPGGKGKVFHRVLAEAGIPVESAQGTGFFTSLEVAVTIDLLAVIDNPHADVPLISVLRSPAFGFSPDELTAIRTADRSSDFFGAVCAAAEQGNARCAEFLGRLEHWRALAPEIGLDALVWRLCSETGLFAICAAMSDGEIRRRNLMQLFEYAHSFGESGYKGLFRFVRWLRRMAEKGMEPEQGSVGQAVRIMSIHRSKGLEFPFVFLCDLSHRFNRRDTADCVLLHSELGLGPKYVDPERGIEYPTLARRAVERRLTTEMLSEEMRVLYVAMTRARERLILSCVWKNPDKTLAAYRRNAADPLPPETLRGAADLSAWLGMAAVSFPEILPVFVHGGKAEAAADAERAEPVPPEGEAVAAEEAALRERLRFAYPYGGSVDLPSKLTATELKRAAGDEDALPMLPEEPELRFRLPEPGKAQRLSAAKRGTATHAFLQFVDLKKTGSLASLRAEAERLCAEGRLTPEEAAAIDLRSLQRFFASPLGERLRNAEAPRREFRFLLLAQAERYFPEAAGSGDELLLQGVVDCCFAEDGGVTILDYKTDRVTAAEVPLRGERYRPQLETYAGALERIFGLPVKHCILWFLHPGAEYEVVREKA